MVFPKHGVRAPISGAVIKAGPYAYPAKQLSNIMKYGGKYLHNPPYVVNKNHVKISVIIRS